MKGLRRSLTLARYARPHRRAIALLVATMSTDVGLDLLKPWPLKLIVDDVLGHHRVPAAVAVLPGARDPHTLALWLAIATVVILGLALCSSTLYNYASLRIGQRMVFALAGDLFAHLQRLSLRYHGRRQLGDTIERVTGDAYCVSTLVTDALIPAVQAVVTLAAMFAVMWTLAPALTLVAIAVVPFLVVVVRRMGAPIHLRAREQRDLEGELSSAVERTLSALPVVQAFAREDAEESAFRALAGRTLNASLRATLAGIRFELLTGAVTAIGTGAVIYIGAELALRGRLTAGTIIVFLAYLASLYDPLDSLTNTGQTIQGAVAEADRVLEILQAEPEVRDRPGAHAAVVHGPVRFEHVTFGYEPGRAILRDVSLTLEPGETVAIVGPSGAGKSTLASLLVRFYDPWLGRVTIGGRDLRDMRHRSLRSQVALVLQDPFILPLTIEQNIAYGDPQATRADVEAAARGAGAHEFIVALPDGYDTEVGERGVSLSGGERQRLAIARALLKEAALLILDEPTAALDARAEALLVDTLRGGRTRRMTVLIAHRLSTIANADTILVLEHGRVLQRGSHHELLARGGLYAELHRHQSAHQRQPVTLAGDG